jgi:hypothetical protein
MPTTSPPPPDVPKGRPSSSSLFGQGDGRPGFPALRILHALIFVALLGYWTYLLLKPSPVPESLLPEITWFDKVVLYFLLAKALHLSSYAFMAVLGGSLVPAGRWRNVVLGFLIFHGAATEFGQWVGNRYFETNRQGCVRDVLIDTAGIAAGAWVLRVAARRFPPRDNRE